MALYEGVTVKEVVNQGWTKKPTGATALECVNKGVLQPTQPTLEPYLHTSAATTLEGVNFQWASGKGAEVITALNGGAIVKKIVVWVYALPITTGKRLKISTVTPAHSAEPELTEGASAWYKLEVTAALTKAELEALTVQLEKLLTIEVRVYEVYLSVETEASSTTVKNSMGARVAAVGGRVASGLSTMSVGVHAGVSGGAVGSTTTRTSVGARTASGTRGLRRLGSGLLYAAGSMGFSSLAGWTNEGGWSADEDPTMLCPAGPYPLGSLGPNPSSGKGSDYDTIREGQLYVENGEWWMVYDSGDHRTGWVQYLARSHDQGLTWARRGILGTSLGAYEGVSTGFLEKRGATYLMHRLVAKSVSATGIVLGTPEPPYGYDIWEASSLTGTWTLVRTISSKGIGSTWAKYECYPGSVRLQAGTYYSFIGGRAVKFATESEATFETVGYMTGTAAGGPYTLNETALLGLAQFNGRQPENPKVFYHAGLARFVMIGNLVSVNGLKTDANFCLAATTVTGFNSSSPVHLQQALSPLQGSTLAIGATAPATGPEGELVEDNGYVPVTFDTSPDRPTEAGGWHLGRKVALALLEPSAYAAKFSSSEVTRSALLRPLTHTSFTAKFSLRMESPTGGDIGFRYRQELEAVASCYEVRLRSKSTVQLIKLTAGVESVLATATEGEVHGEGATTNQQWDYVRVEVLGALHRVWLNGVLVIEHEDASYSTGSYIALAGHKATAQVRLVALYEARTVVVKGLPKAQPVLLRGYGSLPVQWALANTAGEATFTITHGPYKYIEANGVAYTPEEGIWGGDEYELTGLTALKAGWVFPLDEVTPSSTTAKYHVGAHTASRGERIASTTTKASAGVQASTTGGRTASTLSKASAGTHTASVGERTGLAQPQASIGAHTASIGERVANTTTKTIVGLRAISTGGRTAATSASFSIGVRAKGAGERTATASPRAPVGVHTASQGERVSSTAAMNSIGLHCASTAGYHTHVAIGAHTSSTGERTASIASTASIGIHARSTGERTFVPPPEFGRSITGVPQGPRVGRQRGPGTGEASPTTEVGGP